MGVKIKVGPVAVGVDMSMYTATVAGTQVSLSRQLVAPK